MTGIEWSAATDPAPMVQFLQAKSSDRKLRLFAVACCRRAWPWCETPDVSIITALEQHAHGLGLIPRVNAFQHDRLLCSVCSPFATSAALRTATVAAAVVATGTLGSSPRADLETWRAADSVESAEQATLLRDIFGNPFRPVAFSPSWRTPPALALADRMYESRTFDVMPILADALQDAGCENEDILGHCRGTGPHVRGCWVVDLVLGKE
ncbi:Uncharacterized protein OS=Sorangium cellulosum (strain So ce56) GN=sce5710 PE=4 SV=1 [Gemmata massiliana]|uniref:SMI1/KNR4 family protein n=1 Tax=Gemmata massiliana TaxID=1210884 RepID=A0A6P2CV45_9BACT|nr:hypothetical protein [Gemmata massiliana]VTR91574.1 Uncharacterized protein OS=Sorangium cellulosum (strain So ce56) GN=sce5710 PE=4 SV=1 [Gemmata massiliana]